MAEDNFDNYHTLKLIEALTSLIEKQSIDREVVDYLKHTLRFLPWNDEISDAWVELLKLINAHLNQLEDFTTHQEELEEYVDFFDTTRQKFEILEMIIINAFQLNRFEAALEYVNRQINLAEEEGDRELLNRSYHTKGVVYHVSGQLEEAKEWYFNAYDKLNGLDNFKLVDQTLYSIANLHQHYLADYDTALSFYTRGYTNAKSRGNLEREAFYLDHMAMAEFEKDNYQDAIEFHDQAWELLKDQERSVNILFHKVQLCMALTKLGKYERVGEELLDVLDLHQSNPDPYSNTLYLLLLSQFAAEKPANYDQIKVKVEEATDGEMEPLNLIQKAKEVAEQTKHIPSMVNSNIYLAKYKMETDPAEAISLLSEAKQLATQNNRKREIKNIQDAMVEIGLDFDSI